jgi:hypothetical protein
MQRSGSFYFARRSMKRRIFPVLLLLAFSSPARAQNVHDFSAYFGSIFTTTGAAAVMAEQPMLGDSTNIWGLAPLYTHESFGDFGGGGAFGDVSANVYGGSIYASFLRGRLGLTATGGYIDPKCLDGVDCTGFATIGGSLLYRLLRTSVVSDYEGGRFTMSLRVAGGYAFAPDSDRYVSASAGIPLAFSAPEGTCRIVGFLTPGFTWGSLKTVLLESGGNVIAPIDEHGVRGVLSGGVAFVPSAAGVGLHLGFQRIFVDHAGTQYSAALSWNLPRLGDH